MSRVIAICYIGWMFDFYDLALFSYLIPYIGKALALSEHQEAWLLGVGLGASGIGGILFGWLGDRFGRKSVMTWTILLYSFGTGLSAFAATPAQFFVLRIIAGLGIGGEWAIGHALVAESVPIHKRGRASALLQSGEPVGVALAAVVGLFLTSVIGWRAVLGFSALTSIWALVVRRYLPESKLWDRVARESVAERRKARDWLRSFKGISVMFRSLVLATFKLGTYWTMYIWLPKFFLNRFHEPIGRSLLWIVTAQVGQFIGMYFFGPISDTHGRRQAYTLYSIVSALAIGMLAFHWGWLLEHRSYFWVTMFCLGLGSGCTAGFGALLAELFPTEVRNFGMGTTYNLARGVQVFAPPLVAYFMVRWDVAGALAVPLVLAVLTATWVWTLPETRSRNLARFDYEQ